MEGALYNVASTLIVTSVPPVFLTTVTGQSLHVEWSVRKSRTASPDQATITIFNLSPEMRLALQASKKIPGPVFVVLSIGWNGIPEMVFSGEVWKLVAERREHNGDILSTIEAGDGALSAQTTPPAGGAFLSVPLQMAVAKIVGQLGWKPSPAAVAEIAAKAATLSIQTIQISGDRDLRTQLSELLATLRLSWGVAGGRFVVYSSGIRRDAAPVVLNPMTGLLEWEAVDDGGARFVALAQPRLEPGCPVTIQDPYKQIVSGPMRVEEIGFDGTSDGPSTMTGLARPLEVF